MKNYYNFIIIILFFPFLFLNAQTKVGRRVHADQKISKESRISSAQFADGMIAFYSKNFSTAETIFRDVINANPQNDAACFMLAKVSIQKNDFSGALPYLLQAIKIDDQNVWYEVEIANLYEKMGNYPLAEKSWIKVCKKVTNNEYYLYALASMFIKNEKFEDAIQTFDKMEAIIGYNEELTETKKNIWLYLNKVENAVQEYSRWIEKYPFEIKNYITVAQIYTNNEMTDKAIQTLKKGEKIDSNNLDILFTFISIYELKNEKSALNYYKEKLFLQKDIDNKIFHKIEEETKINRKKGDPVSILKSIDILRVYCQNNPDNGEAFGLLSHIYYYIKDDTKALEYSTLAISKNDLRFETWNLYYILLYKAGNFNEIIKRSKDIEILFPTQSFFLNLTAYSFFQTGDTVNAKKWFHYCLTYATDDLLLEIVSLGLGDIYFSENNKTEALKYWKMAQRYGDKSEKLIEKINSLK